MALFSVRSSVIDLLLHIRSHVLYSLKTKASTGWRTIQINEVSIRFICVMDTGGEARDRGNGRMATLHGSQATREAEKIRLRLYRQRKRAAKISTQESMSSQSDSFCTPESTGSHQTSFDTPVRPSLNNITNATTTSTLPNFHFPYQQKDLQVPPQPLRMINQSRSTVTAQGSSDCPNQQQQQRTAGKSPCSGTQHGSHTFMSSTIQSPNTLVSPTSHGSHILVSSTIQGSNTLVPTPSTVGFPLQTTSSATVTLGRRTAAQGFPVNDENVPPCKSRRQVNEIVPLYINPKYSKRMKKGRLKFIKLAAACVPRITDTEGSNFYIAADHRSVNELQALNIGNFF